MRKFGILLIITAIALIVFCSIYYGQTALPLTTTQAGLEYTAFACLGIGLGILLTLSKYKQQ